MKGRTLIAGASALLLCVNCARYTAEPGILGLALLGLRARSANPVGKIYSGLTPMTASSQAISLGGVVDLSRSLVLCYFRTSSSDPSSAPTCTLSDTATIQVDTGATFAGYEVQWYVVEFAGGTTVQRGLATFAPTDTAQDISISSVDTSHAFSIVTSRIPENVSRLVDQERLVRSQITSSSNLHLDRLATSPAMCGMPAVACDVNVAWQVVQLADAGVQSGAFTMTTASANQTLTPVNLTKSFVLFSYSPNAAAGGIEGDYMIAPSLSDSSTLNFTRNSATSTIDVAWHVIEMRDDTFVQSGSVVDSTYPAVSVNITPGTAVNQNASIATVFTSVAAAANSDVDAAYYTPTYTSSSNLRLTRGTTDGAGPAITLRWQAVQFVAQ